MTNEREADVVIEMDDDINDEEMASLSTLCRDDMNHFAAVSGAWAFHVNNMPSDVRSQWIALDRNERQRFRIMFYTGFGYLWKAIHSTEELQRQAPGGVH